MKPITIISITAVLAGALFLGSYLGQKGLPDLEWRGFAIRPYNVATLEPQVQWWPLGVKAEPPVFRTFSRDYEAERQQREQEQQVQRLDERISCLQDEARNPPINSWC
jgi:hypothetical protein